ncbi:unnamed protein product [Heligmosomoides polygyrus]|uniref:RING-type E3 ubiquitin transferase n=1 Tax=Heligmosomoides polygyrus TaxID=6339 RepID=A0A183FKD5_HELPZ|nr:unnamed protein product [Heligmosomoides polygyrus]
MAFLLKYYTFSAKIRTLSEFQVRLSTNQQPPSNAEIITTLRYFHQTLIGFLKDFPQGQTQFCERFSSDPARWNLYPNLNYSGLFYAIINLLESAFGGAIWTIFSAIGEAVLDTLKALMMFLDRDTLEQLPLLLASHIGIFPSELDRQIVHLLADAVLPFAINEDTFIKLSVPGVLMLVLQQANDPSLHTWIMEGTMNSSPNIYQDLVQRILLAQFMNEISACKICTVFSVKSCYDPVICADVADTSPPVFLCRRCADNVIAERKAPMKILTQPMQASSATCQNKECMAALHAHCETPHLVHRGSGCVWGQEVMWGTVEGIVKLLRETAQFEGTEGEGKRPKWLRQLEGGHSLGKEIDTMADERRMLSRFGVWMMAALCPPNQNADPFVCDWINMAIRVHYDVFIAALSPGPEEEGRHFEQTKEGLARLLALMPYDVISIETWSRVMPKWLQLIHEKCSEEHQHELKILLCKIFEPDLCPLPFETVMVFDFVSSRLAGTDYQELFNALQWLHLLSRLEISIPLDMLLEKFSLSLQGLSAMEIPRLGQNDLEEDDVSIHIVIIDILVLQLRLNEIAVHEQSSLTEKLFACVSLLLSVPLRTTPHECKNPELDGFADCSACQQAAFLHQMIMNMTENVSPKMEMAITATEDEMADTYDATSPGTSHPSSALSPHTAPGSKGASPATTSAPAPFSEGGLCFQTATVEHTGDDEFVGILPSEEGSTPSNQQLPKIPPDDFYVTSVGRFRFSIDQLPPQLKMIHALLVNLELAEDPDVENFIMNTLKFLCLHCGSLSNARREHRGFLIWIQEHMMVPKLWARLRSDFVQVGELASLLLLHCISFPSGEETFWRVVHKDFASPDWKIRFDAVGKAYVMAHVIKMAPVKGNKVVQTALSALFYHFVTSLHDPNPTVAQRAIIALRALPSQTLKMMCFCLESQFDSCIIDRPVIINTIRLLTTQLPDETMLTFDFFIQAIEEAATAKSIVKYLREYNALKHQLSYQPSEPPALVCYFSSCYSPDLIFHTCNKFIYEQLY